MHSKCKLFDECSVASVALFCIDYTEIIVSFIIRRLASVAIKVKHVSL